MTSTITVSAVEDISSFISLEEEWNSLLEKSRENSIFLRHEWFRCWWEAYGRGKKLLVLLARENGNLAGIGPFMISKGTFRGLPVRRISFIENDESPRSSIICDHKNDEIIKNVLTYILHQKKVWDIISLNKIPTDSHTYEVVTALCNANGLPYLEKASLSSPYLRIQEDWDLFYQSTSQKFKKRMRSNRNRLQRLGDITIENITRLNGTAAPLDMLFQVGEKCWKNKIGKSISSNDETRRFFSSLSSAAAEKGWLSIWLMKVQDTPVAYEYHLAYRGTVHGLRSEFDESYAAYSPGSVLDGHVVRSIFESGATEYDMGGAANDYKLHWTPHIRGHVNFLIFSRSIYPRLLRLLDGKIVPSLKKVRGLTLCLKRLRGDGSKRKEIRL